MIAALPREPPVPRVKNMVHYSAPASYRNDWGGPSLTGVFAVHSAARRINATLGMIDKHPYNA